MRVFFGQRAASTYSSDFSAAGIERMLKSALELAKITSEDPYAGIPDAAKLGALAGDLNLYHEDVYSLPGADALTTRDAPKRPRSTPTRALRIPRRIVRRRHRPQGPGEFSRLCRRISAVVLLGRRRAHRARR